MKQNYSAEFAAAETSKKNDTVVPVGNRVARIFGRQSGKTEMQRRIAEQYFTLDEASVLDWGKISVDAATPSDLVVDGVIQVTASQAEVKSTDDLPIIHAPTHTREAYDMKTMPGIVEWAAQQVRELNADAIVACGHSGLTIAGAVSYLTKVPVFAVRKEGEPSVAGSPMVTGVAPHGKAQRWVWLDDFIGSGGTFGRSRGAVWRAGMIANASPIAALLYGSRKGTKEWADGEQLVVRGYDP